MKGAEVFDALAKDLATSQDVDDADPLTPPRPHPTIRTLPHLVKALVAACGRVAPALPAPAPA